MTPKQIKQQIALLKKEGINRVLYDSFIVYRTKIIDGKLSRPLSETVQKVTEILMCEYKSQLPKKVVKVKQKTLQEEIDQVYKERGNIKERFNDIDNGRN